MRGTATKQDSNEGLISALADLAGHRPATVAGHSLSVGFLAEAARTPAAIKEMQVVSRHKSVSVLPGYVRSAEIFDDHAGAGFLEVAGMGEASTEIRGRQGEHGCGQVADQAESQRGCDGGLFVRALSLKLGF